jgi:hypothetical protein
LKKILKAAAIVLSMALACISFIFTGSEQEQVFYLGCAFGLAAILVFIMSIMAEKKILAVEINNEEKTQ